MRKLEMKESELGYQLIINSKSLYNLVSIPGGSYKREDGKTIEMDAFYMGQFPVTQELYEEITGNNPSIFMGSNHPVENVSWYEAVKYCGILNKGLMDSGLQGVSWLSMLYELSDMELDSFQFNPLKTRLCLPTEAEWEYASRGNSIESQCYSGSVRPDLVCWDNENNDLKTKPVGLKFPNSFGLYDMSGNVWEWCWDWYSNYERDSSNNPVGLSLGARRVIRGGSVLYKAIDCRSDSRYSYCPSDCSNEIGFRLVFVP